jgi:Domain of unknown function (DUF4249)
MKIKHIIIPFLSIFSFIACEKEYNPDLPNQADDIVVEGYIEAGRDATPAYVLLTKSLPFFKEIKNANNLFENGAEVWIGNGKDSVRLQEYCWKDLDPAIRQQAAKAFGIEIDSVTAEFNFCVYLDFAQRIKGESGKTYTLRIKTKGGKILTSKTTIPRGVPIDSAIFIKPPGINENDTMAQMRAYANDPKGADFYRYFTAVNGSAYVAGASSVTDDAFFDGVNTKFNLFKSEPRDGGADPSVFGLWKRGDTISVKFCTIDKAHFDFWNTLEYNANSGGPFSAYTRVKHNIVGGLGIWGGYNANYYDAIVPKK